jgi:proton glutamate symport protein
MARTAVNIVGNSLAALVITKWESKKGNRLEEIAEQKIA